MLLPSLGFGAIKVDNNLRTGFFIEKEQTAK